jgi:hypothetical protein
MPRELWSAGIVDALLEARSERVTPLSDEVRRTLKNDLRDMLETEVFKELEGSLSSFARWKYRRLPLDARFRFLQKQAKNGTHVFDNTVNEFVQRYIR